MCSSCIPDAAHNADVLQVMAKLASVMRPGHIRSIVPNIIDFSAVDRRHEIL